MKTRLDDLLVEKNLAPSRSQARLLIKEGKVSVNDELSEKPGRPTNPKAKITLAAENHYVSRGAKKIAHATEEFKIDFKDKVVADVGASTGGFTDFVLQNGARKVYAIDVGTDQLAPKIASNPKVTNMQQTNIRDLTSLPEPADITVADLSHISLRLTLKNIFAITKAKGQIITLFKPQFETGQKITGKGGVIRDHKLREKILHDFLAWIQKNNFPKPKITPSPITGKSGNQEYLLYFTVAESP